MSCLSVPVICLSRKVCSKPARELEFDTHSLDQPDKHMGDSTQPQQKSTGTGQNCDFVIAVNSYPYPVFGIFFTY